MSKMGKCLHCEFKRECCDQATPLKSHEVHRMRALNPAVEIRYTGSGMAYMNGDPSEPCIFQRDSDGGCSIYRDRPQVCFQFDCSEGFLADRVRRRFTGEPVIQNLENH